MRTIVRRYMRTYVRRYMLTYVRRYMPRPPPMPNFGVASIRHWQCHFTVANAESALPMPNRRCRCQIGVANAKSALAMLYQRGHCRIGVANAKLALRSAKHAPNPTKIRIYRRCQIGVANAKSALPMPIWRWQCQIGVGAARSASAMPLFRDSVGNAELKRSATNALVCIAFCVGLD